MQKFFSRKLTSDNATTSQSRDATQGLNPDAVRVAHQLTQPTQQVWTSANLVSLLLCAAYIHRQRPTTRGDESLTSLESYSAVVQQALSETLFKTDTFHEFLYTVVGIVAAGGKIREKINLGFLLALLQENNNLILLPVISSVLHQEGHTSLALAVEQSFVWQLKLKIVPRLLGQVGTAVERLDALEQASSVSFLLRNPDHVSLVLDALLSQLDTVAATHAGQDDKKARAKKAVQQDTKRILFFTIIDLIPQINSIERQAMVTMLLLDLVSNDDVSAYLQGHPTNLLHGLSILFRVLPAESSNKIAERLFENFDNACGISHGNLPEPERINDETIKFAVLLSLYVVNTHDVKQPDFATLNRLKNKVGQLVRLEEAQGTDDALTQLFQLYVRLCHGYHFLQIQNATSFLLENAVSLCEIKFNLTGDISTDDVAALIGLKGTTELPEGVAERIVKLLLSAVNEKIQTHSETFGSQILLRETFRRDDPVQHHPATQQANAAVEFISCAVIGLACYGPSVVNGALSSQALRSILACDNSYSARSDRLVAECLAVSNDNDCEQGALGRATMDYATSVVKKMTDQTALALISGVDDDALGQNLVDVLYHYVDELILHIPQLLGANEVGQPVEHPYLTHILQKIREIVLQQEGNGDEQNIIVNLFRGLRLCAENPEAPAADRAASLRVLAANFTDDLPTLVARLSAETSMPNLVKLHLLSVKNAMGNFDEATAAEFLTVATDENDALFLRCFALSCYPDIVQALHYDNDRISQAWADVLAIEIQPALAESVFTAAAALAVQSDDLNLVSRLWDHYLLPYYQAHDAACIRYIAPACVHIAASQHVDSQYIEHIMDALVADVSLEAVGITANSEYCELFELLTALADICNTDAVRLSTVTALVDIANKIPSTAFHRQWQYGVVKLLSGIQGAEAQCRELMTLCECIGDVRNPHARSILDRLGERLQAVSSASRQQFVAALQPAIASGSSAPADMQQGAMLGVTLAGCSYDDTATKVAVLKAASGGKHSLFYTARLQKRQVFFDVMCSSPNPYELLQGIYNKAFQADGALEQPLIDFVKKYEAQPDDTSAKEIMMLSTTLLMTTLRDSECQRSLTKENQQLCRQMVKALAPLQKNIASSKSVNRVIVNLQAIKQRCDPVLLNASPAVKASFEKLAAVTFDNSGNAVFSKTDDTLTTVIDETKLDLTKMIDHYIQQLADYAIQLDPSLEQQSAFAQAAP